MASVKIRDRIKELRRVKASELVANEENWRLHPERQRNAMNAVLNEIGYADALLVRELPDGRLKLIDGHLRQSLTPKQEVPVLVLDVDETEARTLLATFDPIAGMAEADNEKLRAILDGIESKDKDLNDLIASISTQYDLPAEEEKKPEATDELPDAPEPITALGETWSLGRHKILIGDVFDRLKDIPDESVQCVVTSPPYWGLRDYSTARWEGGSPDCDHKQEKTGDVEYVGSDGKAGKNCTSWQGAGRHATVKVGGACPKCGATRVDDQLGLEETPEKHVANMVAVFRELKRVLRADGSCWVNYGDSYQDKQLVGMPWRVAFGLQADGWYLRSDIIWHKNNPMPESCTDRPTKSHEHVFLLTKAAKYFYDADGVRENALRAGCIPMGSKKAGVSKEVSRINDKTAHSPVGKYRNLRDVWTIATQPMKDAHFATFPVKLVQPCIKAGTSEEGCCSKCGAAWVRDAKDIGEKTWKEKDRDVSTKGTRGLTFGRSSQVVTFGWSPSCKCEEDAQPCAVLDPFNGAGTVTVVAEELGRSALGIELNPEYADISIRRWEAMTGAKATKV